MKNNWKIENWKKQKSIKDTIIKYLIFYEYLTALIHIDPIMHVRTSSASFVSVIFAIR